MSWIPTLRVSSAGGTTRPPQPAAVGTSTPWRWRQPPQTARPRSEWCCSRGVDEGNLCFYTGYESRKASELDQNPMPPCSFTGRRSVARCGSKVGWRASPPTVPTRISRAARTTARWEPGPPTRVRYWNPAPSSTSPPSRRRRVAGGDIPRPERWGGYRLGPERYEFWQHGDARLTTASGIAWSRGRGSSSGSLPEHLAHAARRRGQKRLGERGVEPTVERPGIAAIGAAGRRSCRCPLPGWRTPIGIPRRHRRCAGSRRRSSRPARAAPPPGRTPSPGSAARRCRTPATHRRQPRPGLSARAATAAARRRSARCARSPRVRGPQSTACSASALRRP